jgi:transcriptional regulator with XRE-family HTH domain
MAEINPTALRALRKRKNLTLDDLAEMSKVDRGTISKIETGKRANPNASTLRKLAGALGVEAHELSSSDADASTRFELASKSQMNVRMAHDARNALHLTALRYGVKPNHILHLAPFLFQWAAEASLNWRRERLAEIDAKLDALSNIAPPKHLSGVVTDHWRGSDILEEERRSIAKRDLFGLLISEEALPISYEESEQNPMAQFLQAVAGSLGEGVTFDHWSPHWSHPGYTLGKAEALEVVGNDEEAAQEIVSGYAPLHELPKEVREQGPQAVAHWAIETGKKKLRELIDVDALMLELGVDDE